MRDTLSAVSIQDMIDEMRGRYPEGLPGETGPQATAQESNQPFHCFVAALIPKQESAYSLSNTLVELIDSGKVPLSKIRTYSIIPSRHLNWGIQYSFHTSAALA